jgi:hypothetical protein
MHRLGGGLGVAEPLDAQAGVELAHGHGQSVEVGPAGGRKAVDVVGQPAGAVSPGRDATDEEVLHVMAGDST